MKIQADFLLCCFPIFSMVYMVKIKLFKLFVMKTKQKRIAIILAILVFGWVVSAVIASCLNLRAYSNFMNVYVTMGLVCGAVTAISIAGTLSKETLSLDADFMFFVIFAILINPALLPFIYVLVITACTLYVPYKMAKFVIRKLQTIAMRSD